MTAQIVSSILLFSSLDGFVLLSCGGLNFSSTALFLVSHFLLWFSPSCLLVWDRDHHQNVQNPLTECKVNLPQKAAFLPSSLNQFKNAIFKEITCQYDTLCVQPQINVFILF